MRFWLVLMAGVLVGTPAWAQQDVTSTPVESLEGDTPVPPAPVVDPAPVTPEPESNSRVVGRDTKVPSTPPPHRAGVKKPTAPVQRDAQGNVVVPLQPKDMDDPVRPRLTKHDGVGRAFNTSAQVMLGALLGAGAATCGMCGFAPILPCATCMGPSLGSPFLVLAGGSWLALFAIPHTVFTTLGIWLPTLNHENDLVAAAVAGASVFAVDVVLGAVGGVVATAVLLRWARAPTDAVLTDRTGFISQIFTPEGQLREMRGADVALFMTVVAVAASAVFLAPLVGVLSYTAVSYVRGSAEEDRAAARAAARETPSKPRRRKAGSPS